MKPQHYDYMTNHILFHVWKQLGQSYTHLYNQLINDPTRNRLYSQIVSKLFCGPIK